MLWLLARTALGGCEAVVPVDDFAERTEAAWQSAVADRLDETRDLVLALEVDLACLEAPLSSEQAAAFHRVEAMKADHAGDRKGAVQAVAAAAQLAPESARTWADERADFGALLDDSAQVRIASTPFDTSLAARVYVDGTVASARPTGLPVVVQIFAPDGAPLFGAWVGGRDALPEAVAFPPVQCAAETEVDDIVADVEKAAAAYADLDVKGFETSLQAVAAGLPCATGQMGLTDAAAIHRLEGIRLFISGAETSAIRSFQQAQALDPGYVPPETLIPPGSSLGDLWALSQRATTTPWLSVDVPPDLKFVVDGLEASQRPASTPAIIQVGTQSGQMLWSRYVPPGASLPALTPLEKEALAVERSRLSPGMRMYRDEGDRRKRRLRRTPLVAASALTLALSAAFYVDNQLINQEYLEPETPHTRLTGLQQRANRSATASSLLLITGSGLAVATFFVR